MVFRSIRLQTKHPLFYKQINHPYNYDLNGKILTKNWSSIWIPWRKKHLRIETERIVSPFKNFRCPKWFLKDPSFSIPKVVKWTRIYKPESKNRICFWKYRLISQRPSRKSHDHATVHFFFSLDASHFDESRNKRKIFFIQSRKLFLEKITHIHMYLKSKRFPTQVRSPTGWWD